MTIEQLREASRTLPAEESIKLISDYIDSHAGEAGLDEAYTLRGMRYWGMQKRSQAINDYLAAIRINPDSRAVEALKAAREILDYYNKDLYNP